VPSPLGGALVLRGVKESKGHAITVTDDQLLEGANLLSSLEGVDACPEGGASVAAARLLHAKGLVTRDERLVLFNTGAGVLYGRGST